MEEKERHAAFMSALITEHSVLQAAANSTVSDAAARSSLYVFSLSSSLVAMGFAAQSRDVFLPFVAVVLPAVFMLGVLTIVRLVDSAIENMQYLAGIARIRGYYRTLTPEAAAFFAAERGRWPEAHTAPSQQLGSLVAFLTTSASTIAFINSFVAGAGVTIFAANVLVAGRIGIALGLGAVATIALIAIFMVFQRWRFSMFDAVPKEARRLDR
jgi:hypothetical protein